jgi:O-succinylbenzoic acid--CoA ligase
MTEACSQVATFGRPLFCTRVRTSEAGELLVSGPTVAPSAGPWLATGDVGVVDERGAVTVTGRAGDTIISGGENVAPQEVEDVLSAHPAVAEAAVRGRPDAEWGEALVAHVVLRADMRAAPEELRDFCAERLAGFKVPKEIVIEQRLPRTPSGKLVRADLGRARS